MVQLHSFNFKTEWIPTSIRYNRKEKKMSILSFPERGKWGDSNWRGNCSGHIYQALFNQYKDVKSFCDPMMGSGTSIAVAKEMGLTAYGLDLHSGFNALRHSIRDTIGQEVDMCHSHPPYSTIFGYSGCVWGDTPHPDDLSHSSNHEDFHEKMHLVLMNQREATKPGGYYGTLIGDLRKNGAYTSLQAECLTRMPANELVSVAIKAQHNTVSGRNTYSKMKHFAITHEYLLLWQKPKAPLSILFDLSEMAKAQAARLQSAWRVIVAHAMMALGGKASLGDLYKKISESAPDKLKSNENWQAKVRQILQVTPKFCSVERGVWAFA